MDNLTEGTRTALERMAEKVRAKGGTLQVTSAYRPEARGLHGQGKAVDVWVPGWTPDKIAEVGKQAGFLGGYKPDKGSFVELVTGRYWYTVPGVKFGEDIELDDELYHRKKMEERGVFERFRAGQPGWPEWDFTRWGIILVFVVLFIILVIIGIKQV